MPNIVVKPNGRGILDVLRSNRVGEELRRRAEASAANARSNAPVDTGDYRDSIHVVMEMHPTRVVAHVVADDWKANIIEARFGTLGRSLDAAR